MEHVYATLTLHETGREINEANLTAVLEAAGAEVVESRVKALVAALEGVDLDDTATRSAAELRDGTAPNADEPSVEGATEPPSGDDRGGERPEDASAEQPEPFDETETKPQAMTSVGSETASSTEREE